MPECPGCTLSFKSLRTHESSCQATIELLRDGPADKKRYREEEKLRQAKQRRLENDAAKAALEAEHAADAEHERRQRDADALAPVFVESFSRAGCPQRAPRHLQDMLPMSLAGLPEHIPRPPPRVLPPLCPPSPAIPEPDNNPRAPTPPVPEPVHTNTRSNRFGVFRRYTSLPQHDPEEGLTIDTFTDVRTHNRRPPLLDASPLCSFGQQALNAVKRGATASFSPFANITVFRIMHWVYSGSSMKTPREMNRLIRDVFLAPEFRLEHIGDFNAEKENERLTKHTETSGAFTSADGWHEGKVKIRLPKERVRHKSEGDTPEFEVSGIYYRPLLEVVKAACTDVSAHSFHWSPFKMFWQHKASPPPSGADPPPAAAPLSGSSPSASTIPPHAAPPPERLFGDSYTADTLLEVHEQVQVKAREDREPGDDPKIEYIAVLMMFGSDSTHLTNFGAAALWPIYLFFANLSKYLRACPSTFSAHHLAYIPSLPATIQKAYQNAYGEPASAAVLRFCKRELMQNIWLLLLDDEFMHAYVHGILLKCGDGVTRRVFPRVFTYTADYPEKCLISCIKFLGKCLCPECLAEKVKAHLMGSVNDMKTRAKQLRRDYHDTHHAIASARKNIFEFGAPPEGATVEGILNATSMTPTRSAFSIRLAQFGFNVYQMLVPDLLHEFELGVWKAVLIHLIRILLAAGGECIQTFDQRQVAYPLKFTLVPTFGRDTIRRFSANVSALKQLAARDFEDRLQCILPVIEGLLPPPHNKIVLDTIFQLATWHALAKLRLHSESTLTFFDEVTRSLGQVIRLFKSKVCPAYDTKELPGETISCQRRQQRKAAAATATPAAGEATQTPKTTTQAKRKTLNTNMYKFHRLGDYPASIRKVGTTDNVSTQTVELEHRRVKRFYAQTNKNTAFAWQIARHQRREAALHRMHARMDPALARTQKKPQKMRSVRVAPPSRPQHGLQLPFTASEPLTSASPKEHTQISEEQAHPVDISAYLSENEDDPAFKDFHADLKIHIYNRLSELAGHPTTQDPTHEDLRAVRIGRNRMYLHKVMRINYTSYDMRRGQDSVNPRSHPDIMMLAPASESHPYLYARVVSIFHVNAYLLRAQDNDADDPELLHILWVRWFELDTTAPAGFKANRPWRVHFAGLDDRPFGFLAPSQVLRTTHLIPAFCHGRSDEALPYPSVVCGDDNENTDYRFYSVGMFSDRDLFMRYLGNAVGHQQAMSPAHAALLPSFNFEDPLHNESAMEEDYEGPTLAGVIGEDLDVRRSDSESSSDEEDPERAYIPSGDEDGDGDDDLPGVVVVGDGNSPADGDVSWNSEDEDEVFAADLGPEDGEGDEELDDFELTGLAPL